MSVGDLLGKVSAAMAGLIFGVLALLIWIGFAGLGTYPLTVRLVFGLAVLVYGGWRARRSWRSAGLRREN